MNTRTLVNPLLGICSLMLAMACSVDSDDRAQGGGPTNPYEGVDWGSFSHYRADLHVHTIQSDGCHHPEEVIRVFHEAGFSILSITDHDTVSPNLCPTRENAWPEAIAAGTVTDEHSPYPDPQPANFPANTTWPWTAFGAPSPAELGMLGVEGSEMTCGHHRSSFFSDYGLQPPCTTSINEQLHEVARRDGRVFINHPEPRFKEWYTELFRYHSADYLLGIEISRDIDNSAAVWDQLLGDLMPSRPVWGFATSDMHFFAQTQFAFTVFVLDQLTMEGVKKAMETGQFYSVVGPGPMDLREAGREAYEGTYPELRSISVNPDSAEIAIDATNYDEIVWITGSPEWRYSVDPETGISWPPGEVVHRGPVFRFPDSGETMRYVRAELIRHSDDGPVRLFLNPFAPSSP